MASVKLMLVDSVCQSMDIRRPLGLSNNWRRALLLGTRLRIAGLRLAATDTAWTVGERPPVEGPIGSLILAMAGRRGRACRPDRRGRGSPFPTHVRTSPHASAGKRRCARHSRPGLRTRAA